MNVLVLLPSFYSVCVSVILDILEKLMQEVRHGAASPLPLSLSTHCLSLSLVALDRPMQRVRNVSASPLASFSRR